MQYITYMIKQRAETLEFNNIKALGDYGHHQKHYQYALLTVPYTQDHIMQFLATDFKW